MQSEVPSLPNANAQPFYVNALNQQ